MLGQEKLVTLLSEQIKKTTLPSTMLFLGEQGCGKHTLAKYLSEELLKIELVDISDNLSLELLEEIQICPFQKIYLIDSNKLDSKKQNIILKFLEEPLVNSYIILLAECRLRLLPTVVNRCIVYEFALYDENQIKEITGINDSLILKYCYTPGKALECKNINLSDYIQYIDKLLTLIGRANWANILNLSNKVYFKEAEKDKENKLSFSIISNIIKQRAVELYEDKQISFDTYNRVRQLCLDLTIYNINKQQLFENFIFDLKGSLVA